MRGLSATPPAWCPASRPDSVGKAAPGHSGHGQSSAPGPAPGLAGNRKYWQRGRDCDLVSGEGEGFKVWPGWGQEIRRRGQEGSQGPANEKAKWSLAPPLERLGLKRRTRSLLPLSLGWFRPFPDGPRRGVTLFPSKPFLLHQSALFRSPPGKPHSARTQLWPLWGPLKRVLPLLLSWRDSGECSLPYSTSSSRPPALPHLHSDPSRAPPCSRAFWGSPITEHPLSHSPTPPTPTLDFPGTALTPP